MADGQGRDLFAVLSAIYNVNIMAPRSGSGADTLSCLAVATIMNNLFALIFNE